MTVLDEMDSALYSAFVGESIPDALQQRWASEAATAWTACDDPCVLVRLLTHADPPTGARAAVRCVETALRRLQPADHAIASACLDAVTRWADGTADGHACYAAGRAAVERARHLGELEACALYSACHAAYIGHATAKGSLEGAVEHAWRAVASAITDRYDDARMQELDPSKQRELAALVREAHPSPPVFTSR